MAIKDAPTVAILPFDEEEAYNPDRPISSLIRTQLHHLHLAECIRVPEKARTNININDLHTELAASEYIQKVTALLHKYGKSGEKAKEAKPPARKAGKKAAGKKTIRKSRKTKTAAKKKKQRK